MNYIAYGPFLTIQRVLEVETGTAVWAMEFADELHGTTTQSAIRNT